MSGFGRGGTGPEPATPLRPWLLRTALISAAGAGLLSVGLRALAYAVAYPLLVALIAAGFTLHRVAGVVAVRVPRSPPVAERDDPGLGEDAVDGFARAVRQWEVRLEWLDGDAEAFGRVMHPRMVAIVEERLRLRYGVSIGADPARARKICGGPLWEFVARPPAEPLTPRSLGALLDRIEAL